MNTNEKKEAIKVSEQVRESHVIRAEEYQAAIDRFRREAGRVMAPMESTLRAMRQELEAKVVPLERAMRAEEKAADEVGESIRRMKAIVALEENPDELNAEGFVNLMVARGLTRAWTTGKNGVVEAIKTKLANGVQLFRRFDSWADNASESQEVYYYAVAKVAGSWEVVGYHWTTKSRHPGDKAEYRAWTGARLLRWDNMALGEYQQHGWTRGMIEVLRFRDWAAVVGSRPSTALQGIVLEDPTNMAILSHDGSLRITDIPEALRRDLGTREIRGAWDHKAEQYRYSDQVLGRVVKVVPAKPEA